MIYKISKKQFNAISKKLIKHFFGELFFYSNGYKTKSYNDIINHIYDDVENVYDYNVDYIEIVDSLENNIMDIWFNEGNVKKGCKNQLRIHLGQVFPLEKFLPILRKKEFSKVIENKEFEKYILKRGKESSDINRKLEPAFNKAIDIRKNDQALFDLKKN